MGGGDIADTQGDHRQRAGDGCYHVFLDLGANIGMHTRFLFEPTQYPRSKYASIFSQYFGDGDRGSACSFEFEPNPKHQVRHEGLVAHYAKRHQRVMYYPRAAGARTTNTTFYPNNVLHDPAKIKRYAVALHQELGFGAAPRANGVAGQGVEVSVLDVARFVNDEIRGRTLPADVARDGDRPPAVVVKMDIEGSEFVVVPRMLDLDVLCATVNFISIEWHTSEKFLPIDVEDANGARVRLETPAEATARADALKRRLRDAARREDCATRFVISGLDDETYFADPFGFPEEAK